MWLKRVLAAFTVLATAAIFPTPGATAAGAELRCDFDADGYADLAVGVPLESIGRSADAGAVNVVYGTADGLRSDGDQLWHQGSPGVPGVAGETENVQAFGESLACGDFDGDGTSDLAVGVPFENLTIDGTSRIDAGAVNVIYGSPAGLTGGGAQIWHQGQPGVAGSPEKNDQFGRALGAGDFNGDGFDDLAVGVPREGVAGMGDHGMVHILFGSGSGLTAAGEQVLGAGATVGWADNGANFGFRLHVGDFDADDFDDLVIANNNRSLGQYLRVVQGSSTGLDPSTSVPLPEPDEFVGAGTPGWSGAVGDVDGDGFDDYVAGAQHYVSIWPGGTNGLEADAAYGIGHSSPGMPAAVDGESSFGVAVAVGDVDADGHADVLVGASNHQVGAIEEAGAAILLFGSAAGVTTDGVQLWHQDSPGIPGVAERFDRMGYAVSIDDFDGDGHGDGVVTAAEEDIITFGTNKPDAGMAIVLPGGADGLTGTASQRWHQARPGINGAVEVRDTLGQAIGR